MKKILVIHSSGIISGGEIVSLSIYKKLKNYFNFSFFIPEIRTISQFNLDDAECFYTNNPGIITIIKKLITVIQNNKPDIVHAHGTRAALFVKLSSLFLKKRFKFLYTIHGFHIAHKKGLKNRIIILLEKITNLFFVDKIICVGENDYKIVLEHSIKKNNIEIIKNGIAPITPKTDKDLENFCKKNDFNLLTISRLHYQKDVKTLILAVKKIKQNIGLVIIGGGPEELALKKLSEDNDNIIFLKKNNASSLIHYFDAFVLATHWEGLPLVILEAMLARVPVIASNVHGVREIINNRKNGLLFPDSNIDALISNIGDVIHKNINLDQLKTEAFNLAASEYSIEKMTDKYKHLYNNL